MPESSQVNNKIPKAIVSSKDIVKLKTWAETNYPWIMWDANIINVRVFSRILQQLVKLGNIYPAVFKTLKGIKFGDLSDSEGNYPMAQYGNQFLEFHLPYWKNEEALQQRLNEFGDQFEFSHYQDKVEAVITHEFGHFIHDWALEGNIREFYYCRQKDGSAVRSVLGHQTEYYHHALTPYKDEHFGTIGGTLSLWIDINIKPISDYAKTDIWPEKGKGIIFCPHESFAEAFTALHHRPAEQQPAFVRQLGRILKIACGSKKWCPEAKDISTLSPAETQLAYREYLIPLMLEFGLSPDLIEKTTTKARRDEIDWHYKDLEDRVRQTKNGLKDEDGYLHY